MITGPSKTRINGGATKRMSINDGEDDVLALLGPAVLLTLNYLLDLLLIYVQVTSTITHLSSFMVCLHSSVLLNYFTAYNITACSVGQALNKPYTRPVDAPDHIECFVSALTAAA